MVRFGASILQFKLLVDTPLSRVVCRRLPDSVHPQGVRHGSRDTVVGGRPG